MEVMIVWLVVLAVAAGLVFVVCDGENTLLEWLDKRDRKRRHEARAARVRGRALAERKGR